MLFEEARNKIGVELTYVEYKEIENLYMNCDFVSQADFWNYWHAMLRVTGFSGKGLAQRIVSDIHFTLLLAFVALLVNGIGCRSVKAYLWPEYDVTEDGMLSP